MIESEYNKKKITSYKPRSLKLSFANFYYKFEVDFITTF